MRKSNLVLLMASIMISAIVLANIGAIPSLQNHVTNAQFDFISTIGPPLQNVVWHRTYGSSGWDASKATQCSDGGFILYGTFNRQALLLRTSNCGEYQWHKKFNTNYYYDSGRSLVITDNGGFALLIRCHEGSSAPHFEDFMIVRTDSSGIQLWNKTYEFSNSSIGTQHFFHSLELCSDGGFIIGGNLEYLYWASDDSLIQRFIPWLLRTDSNGVPLWNSSYFVAKSLFSETMIQCQDRGFAISGMAFSDHPFLLRLNSSGQVSWFQTYTSRAEQVNHMVECSDGSFAFVGYVYDPEAEDSDIFLMKTDAMGNLLWNKTFGLQGKDIAWHIIETANHGLALTGSMNATETGDLFLIVTDSNGNHEWNSTFGETNSDGGLSVYELSNGDFILSGYTENFGAGEADCWLLQIREGYTPPTTPPPPPLLVPWFVIPIGIGITIIVVSWVVVTWLKKRSSLDK